MKEGLETVSNSERGINLKLHKELLMEMLRRMLMIRAMEEKIYEAYTRGEIMGIVDQSTGQEAVPAGLSLALREEDLTVACHRGLGEFITRGVDLGKLVAELMGRAAGYCRGKGGKLHICCLDRGVLLTAAIVGTQIPIATGAAFSVQKRQTGQVVACFFGDGASNMGFFHESLNFASLHKLPVIYVCENNGYAKSISVERSTSIENIGERAAAYSMPGIVADGNDVIAVYEAAHKAATRAREGAGPTLIEYKTYRVAGHHSGDPGRGTKYRTKVEMDAWAKRDPIDSFRRRLLAEKVMSQSRIDNMVKDVASQAETAYGYAKECPLPEAEEALTGVFAD
jgi:pyruvate dehydrogenase E1 component alpha subunit